MATKNKIKARRALVLNFICAGHTEEAVVAELALVGIVTSQPTVHRDIRVALGDLHPKDEKAIEDKRALVDRRYEVIISRIWPMILGTPEVKDAAGDVVTRARRPDLEAVKEVRGVFEAQRRLWGLDKAIDLGAAPGTLVAVMQAWAAANPVTIIENQAGQEGAVEGSFRELPSPAELDDWEPGEHMNGVADDD